MPKPTHRTLGELRAAGFRPRTLREEIRANLLERLRKGEPLFPGIHGYDDSVIPAVENALLCGHDLIFLGERGQAKSRMIRALVALLDEWLPEVAGQRDPRRPLRARSPPFAKQLRRRARRRDRDRAGCTATSATPRSSPRPTSRSPT